MNVIPVYRRLVTYRKAVLLSLLTLVYTSLQAQDVFNRRYIKSTLVKVTDWQLKHPKHRPTDWTNGAFYAGVVAAYETTNDKAFLDSLLALGERTGWQPGARYDHADDIAISQTYIDLYRMRKNRKMVQPTIDTVEKLRTVTGSEVRRHGITWWWCDALFMGPPTLAKLGTTLDDAGYYQLNDSFFRQTYDLLYNHEHHLFARDAGYLVAKEGEGKREKKRQTGLLVAGEWLGNGRTGKIAERTAGELPLTQLLFEPV